METDPPELGSALLRWINSFEFARSVKSWKDLQDGKLLWRVLKEVEPNFFTGDLPEDASGSENWIPRWQNLKHINRLVMNFIRDECGKLQELGRRMDPDLKAIAIDAQPAASQQLAKAVLLAALYYPESNQRMIPILDQLGTKASIAIAQCIGQMEALDRRLVESAPQTDTESDFERMSSPEPDARARVRRQSYRRDPELEHEEKLITAYTKIKQLEERAEALSLDLVESRKEVTDLEKNVKDLNFRLEHGQSADNDALEVLHRRSEQDKDNIEQLEAELADARSAIEQQEKQLDKLYRESEAYHRLQDEAQALRTERDDLRQSSKANENLKKKIQALQDADSSEALRQELSVAQQELQVLRPMKAKVASLQKANEENAKLIQNGEQEIFDQKTTRRRLDHELRLLTRQVESAKEQHRQDLELIHENEERIRELESGSGGAMKEADTLDVEFTTQDSAINDMKSRNLELEAEVKKLREAQVILPDEPVTDQSAYEMLKARCEKLEKQYLDVYQENLGLESAAQDVQSGAVESRPFIEMRDRLKDESELRTMAEKKLFDLEVELSDTKLRLQSVDAKYSAVGKDQDEALKDLQDSASYENKILHKENTRLLGHIRTFEGDLEEHRSLLRHALLDNDALLKQDKDVRFQDELKLITEQLRAVVDDPKRTDDMAMRLTKRTEDSRMQANKAESQLAEEKSNLDARLKRAEEVAAKGSKSADQEGLQRELKLMTTAWYDMTRRMQSDAVIIQRRTEAPKSFLNRQRRLVNSTALPVRLDPRNLFEVHMAVPLTVTSRRGSGPSA